MRSRSLVLVAAFVGSSVATARAQECVGMPKGGKGFFAAGLSGTDGASGTGLSFALKNPKRSLMIDHQSLSVFAAANVQQTTSAQASFYFRKLRGCVTTGASYMSWDTEG